MAKFVKFIPLILVFIIGVIFQGIFILADKSDTPNKTAVEFVKAYYSLDDCTMAKHICASLKSRDAVGDYLYMVNQSAGARGFDAAFLKSSLSHIQTEVVKSDGNTALVALTAQKRTSINPVFEVVGRLFGLIGPTPVKQEIELMKEDGQWKVCGELPRFS
jgi:hypothetical protein